MGDPPTFDDTRLLELALIAALKVNAEVSFPQAYSINIEAQSIAPDPTIVNRDENFISLISLKAASILAFSEAKTSAGQGIDIKDGSSSISLRGVAQAKFQLAKELEQQYQDTKLAYQAGNHVVGNAILGPFRIYFPIYPYNTSYPMY